MGVSGVLSRPEFLDLADVMANELQRDRLFEVIPGAVGDGELRFIGIAEAGDDDDSG